MKSFANKMNKVEFALQKGTLEILGVHYQQQTSCFRVRLLLLFRMRLLSSYIILGRYIYVKQLIGNLISSSHVSGTAKDAGNARTPHNRAISMQNHDYANTSILSNETWRLLIGTLYGAGTLKH